MQRESALPYHYFACFYNISTMCKMKIWGITNAFDIKEIYFTLESGKIGVVLSWGLKRLASLCRGCWADMRDTTSRLSSPSSANLLRRLNRFLQAQNMGLNLGAKKGEVLLTTPPKSTKSSTFIDLHVPSLIFKNKQTRAR